MRKKPDAQAIEDFLDGLPSALGLHSSQKWWPKFIFRSDHVENTAAILESGSLLSRKRAEQGNCIRKDAASNALVSELSETDRGWARLYFRPRTPTQFANEGVRPESKIERDAHMPVPVYILFHAKDVLTQRGVCFSKGRLVTDTEQGNDAAFLASMNFKHIYHDGGVGRVGTENRSKILNARHSEVLVPNELRLDAVHRIVCRSAPERDTLLNLLPPSTASKWAKKMMLEGQFHFFHKRGTFIQKVDLASSYTSFGFFMATSGPDWRGPFRLRIDWMNDDGWSVFYENQNFEVSSTPLKVTLNTTLTSYTVRVTLNGDLVYVGRFNEVTGPEVF